MPTPTSPVQPALPTNPPPTGTIDITATVTAAQSAFVTWAVAFAYGEELLIPGLSWVALPIISDIDKEILREFFTAMASSIVMLGFFENTAIRKGLQAQDFLSATAAKNALPTTATDLEYKNAETAQMAAFRNFVMVVN